MSRLYRLLPSVDFILEDLTQETALAGVPRPLVKDLVNAFLDAIRQGVRDGDLTEPDLAWEALRQRAFEFVTGKARPHFRRVLNATGVVVHTNLGRSLLADEAARAVDMACLRYSNLEFDLDTGARGSRYSHVEDLLCRITGAEAALVVNNNAAAVFIVLNTLCQGREVIVSRGQLVEIGGSFRIPDVMAKSGAVLREVGTTNRTHLFDYERAIGPDTAALMKVHTSNYRMIGFTKEVGLDEMVGLADKHGLPVIDDLGSGNLFNLAPYGMAFEPTVQETVAAGASVVSFSGDKLLGGPQAGIIVGKAEYVERIKKNPLNRAVRIDKMTLAALEATLRLYLDPGMAREKVPTINMITADPEILKKRAVRLARRIRSEMGESVQVATVPGISRVGGGAFPGQDLATTLVSLRPKAGFTVDELKDALLSTDPPLVGRIEEDAFLLDARTLADDEFKLAVEVLGQAINRLNRPGS